MQHFHMKFFFLLFFLSLTFIRLPFWHACALHPTRRSHTHTHTFTRTRYLYCDEIYLEADNVLATLYVAKKYIVPHLARACVNYLETSLTAKNACLLLSQSRLFEEPELMQRCWEVIDAQVCDRLDTFHSNPRTNANDIENCDNGNSIIQHDADTGNAIAHFPILNNSWMMRRRCSVYVGISMSVIDINITCLILNLTIRCDHFLSSTFDEWTFIFFFLHNLQKRLVSIREFAFEYTTQSRAKAFIFL